jgi:erythromycin esterase
MKTLLLFFLLIATLIDIGFCQLIKDKVYLQHADSASTLGYDKLSPFLKNKNLFLVGEANHGSHEIFKVKESFIKYLVQDLGLKDVIIEANFANCLKINEYITWKTEGNAEEFAKSIYVWPYRTEEFANLISWMREFNRNKRSEEQINLWGMDMQQAYPALEILQKELEQSVDNGVLSIPKFEDRMDEIKYNVNDSVINKLSLMVNSANTDDKLILERCLEIVKMQKKFFELYQMGSESLGHYRDSCMAANVEWIYASSKENNKMLVWAHNSHIQKTNQSSMRKSSIGYYLNNSFGKQAYFIGFDFNKGTFIYPDPREKLMTVTEDERHYFARLLDEKKYDLCFIPFTGANQPVLIDAVGMRYNMGLIREKYTDLYDAVFFINEITPIKMLN